MADKYYIILGKRLSKEEREIIEDNGFYVYSLRTWDEGNGSQLEHQVFVNHEADVISNFKMLPDEPDAFEPDFWRFIKEQGAEEGHNYFNNMLGSRISATL